MAWARFAPATWKLRVQYSPTRPPAPTEAHGCEQLAQSCYSTMRRPGVEPATSWLQVQHPTATLPSQGDILLKIAMKILINKLWNLLTRKYVGHYATPNRGESAFWSLGVGVHDTSKNVKYSRRVLEYSLRYSPSTLVANYSDSTALLAGRHTTEKSDLAITYSKQ